MEKLWAPWRSKYIYLRKKTKCIFCVPKKSDKNQDRKNYIIERSRHAFSILNKYPYNNGHIMIAPYRHVKSPDLLTDNELLDLMKLVTRTKRGLDELLKPHGYNIGCNLGKISGAGFDRHFHMHIVPRWVGDTNFMPVVGDTKIVSEYLDTIYNVLQKTKI